MFRVSFRRPGCFSLAQILNYVTFNLAIYTSVLRSGEFGAPNGLILLYTELQSIPKLGDFH